METDTDSKPYEPSTGSSSGGDAMCSVNDTSGSVNIRSSVTSTTPAAGSCPNNSFLFSGRSCSPNPILQRPSRACPSPISSIVGTALNQLNLKRSSSAPMINQLGTGRDDPAPSGTVTGTSNAVPTTALSLTTTVKDSVEVDAASLATSFLSSLSGSRPRRFSASFSPGSPGPAPSRVSQLRHEDHPDWETVSEKDFNGTSNIAQSWEDLSLDSMSMEVTTRRPSLSDQLWLSMPQTSSASSSPAASPRVLSRFSPSLSSPSPTRKSFTTRRSLSPIAVRPSVLGGQGVKRKCDWDSKEMMDCSPQPAKRAGGLLSFPMGNPMPAVTQTSVPNTCYQPAPSYNFAGNTIVANSHSFFTTTQAIQPQPSSSPFNPNSSTSSSSLVSMVTNHVEDSQNSNETESSVSSNGGRESPFFRPVDSPLHSATTPEDSPHPPLPKM